MSLFRILMAAAIAFCMAGAADLTAQEVSRAQEAEAIRLRKRAEIRPERPTAVEGAMLWIQERKIRERLETPGAGYKGIRPRLGGFSTGSGFGFGLQYDKVRIWNDQADFSVGGAVSLAKYQLYEMKLDFPRLADEQLFVTASARHRSMPREDYFGSGADSIKENRTSYLYEDQSYGLRGGVRVFPWMTLGGSVDWMPVNVGPGEDPRFPSTEILFDDGNAPGVNEQPDFLREELFASVDTRDSQGNPHRGGFYGISYARYDDRDLEAFNFERVETDIEQYVPFNDGHRVIAFRFHTSWSDPRAGDRVPFYLQQPLGGSNDLRGFREFRFRDKNQMVFNLEYRWEAWIGLDMAIFGDAGKVFERREDFDLDDLESAYGLGFRFNTAKSVFLRIDIGHGREGTRAFIKFDHVF